MADGDFDVKILIKSRFAGGGHGLTAGASNSKIEVVADITGTYNTGGIVLGAIDLGLSKIDAIFISPNVHHSTDTAPTATIPNLGIYTTTSGIDGNLILVDDASTQVEADDSETFSVSVLAYGDAAGAPVLS